ncbi:MULTISPECIES: ABC transporter ATP-binding protein [Variovorax]|uniref:ABC transporter ATP-binding protein n=1 Tax=Variovorax TaxID=34072 RepID=UPI00086879D3|nr:MULTISPECIES: ABC transporter ATP-binding protein [Variovorax]MBN8754980.1 ABC transporter ATP-binding protein [Variovorax sp.]ODU14800.1 MAG: Fe3+/spermidine/putrescine ABC transporter ATP-binding protein [Variovorax sp. SCN 67-85]ODV26134.1 MAG: Fe3+/spermidine/putrescine ABC transporter ATP-binding protein [Variovorax sp. SCN 67-20]OJZ03643.1 MAG: Fe3+/spermidine/putrescine ABC transporter ATP-binding protein [Variovorax sp. 67-131]UKI07344.1 ABC transporter ATP-binding protein [Variovor
MSYLRLDNLQCTYDRTVAVRNLNLDVAQGELLALLGPSGCGKSTTLRMVAGFVQPSAGRIFFGEREVTHAPPHARDTGMVFQGYALFMHMSVAENVAFGLQMRKVPRAEQAARVKEALRLVRLDHLADRRPAALSGGQQQRVALARALVVQPAVFLLDEPMSNLDARLRTEVRLEIRALQQRLGLTTLLVTHDQEEALTTADRLAVMDHGRVRQVGTPRQVYEQPVDQFVANFIGRCNLVPGRLDAPGVFRAGAHALPCAPFEGLQSTKNDLALMVRPDRIRIANAGEQGLPARVRLSTYLGGTTEWNFETDVGPIAVAQPSTLAHGTGARGPAEGERVSLQWSPEHALALPADATSA